MWEVARAGVEGGNEVGRWAGDNCGVIKRHEEVW